MGFNSGFKVLNTPTELQNYMLDN